MTRPHTPKIEAENTRLRARIEELERRLYPPPPPPEKIDDPRRFLLAWAWEGDNAWTRLQEVFTRWAYDYARERHPDVQWARAYRWDDLPEGGIYTTAKDALDAKRAETDVQFYEIDKRTEAIDAVKAQMNRIRARESEFLHSIPHTDDDDRLSKHRVWAHRRHILKQADKRAWRAYSAACDIFVGYRDIMRAATETADQALIAVDADLSVEDVPGYLSEGWWECKDCGYPYPDSEAHARGGGDVFRCCACRVANLRTAQFQAELIEEFRAEGDDDVADKLEQDWQTAVDRAATTLNAR